MQKPFPERSTIDEGTNIVEITIPSPKDWFLFSFLAVMLVVTLSLMALFVVLFSSASQNPANLSSPLPFIVLMIMFSICTVVFANSLSWTLFGFEIIKFSSQTISIEQRIFSFKRERFYSNSHIRRIRTLQIPEFHRTDQSSVWIKGPSSLAFDYGAKTIRFGRGVDEAEAAQILERVMAKFPQYRSSSAVGGA